MGLKDKLKGLAEKLKIELPALWIALRKKETPFWAKLFAALTVAYALSPIDLIPDFIPVIGYLDDLVILPLLVILTLKFIPQDLWRQCLEESKGLWDNGKPKKWYYAIPIVIFWALIVFLIVKAFLPK